MKTTKKTSESDQSHAQPTDEEALLVGVEEQLVAIQSGPGACAENVMAIAHVQQAIGLLRLRNKRRAEAGASGA